MSDDLLVHDLLRQLLEVAPTARAEWLSKALPSDSALRIRLLDALTAAQTKSAAGVPDITFAVKPASRDDALLGRRLGAYRIDYRLSEQGGMGTVYHGLRADGVFEQEVAIKVLARGRDTDTFLQRFVLERHVLGRLQHPYIVRILDGGATSDGRPYLVTEWVTGLPIDAHCVAQALDLRQRVLLFDRVCEAVQSAHERDVIHRDLKPGNILVTQAGHPKLLDFGLAKLLTANLVEDLGRTMVAERIMTPAYGSPEQIRGDRITPSVDVYALRVILYELLTGVRPYEFHSSSATEIERVVCEHEPEPPSQRITLRQEESTSPQAVQAADLEGALDAIVMRALRKDSTARYPTVADLRTDLALFLDAPLPAGKARGDRSADKPLRAQSSIAVLPFIDLSPLKDHEWLSDGIAEEIINALSHLTGVMVIARTSAFAFKGKQDDVRRIAAALNVEHVLEGSVRRFGDRVRVTAQLIAARSGASVWSDRFDGDMADVFGIQDRIAEAIRSAFRLTLPPSALTEPHKPALPAYEAYLKARHHWGRATPEALVLSKQYYDLAITLDPAFTKAHIGLADYYLLMTSGVGVMASDEAMPVIRAIADRVLAGDPAVAEAHALRGIVAGVYDYNWIEAERCFQRAIERQPLSSQVSAWYGNFYLVPLGRFNAAVEALESAINGDPLNAVYRAVLSVRLASAHRYDDALAETHHALELIDAHGSPVVCWVAWTYALAGAHEEALAVAERGYAPWNAMSVGVLSGLLARHGNTARADELMEPLRAMSDRYGVQRGLAAFEFLRGDRECAANWLEQALVQRDPVGLEIAWPVLERHPRWPTLARMGNLPETSGPATV